MRRLPPPSMASLPSMFFSFLLHGGAVIGTLLAMPQAEPLPIMEQHYVPIELVDLSESTNLTAVAAAMEQAQDQAAAAEETEAAPPPAPPPAEEDAVSFEPPREQPKTEPRKDIKAAPTPSKSLSEELDEILKGVPDKPKPQQNNAATAPAGGAPQAPRKCVGDCRQMQATIIDILVSQLKDKGCWADHSDMADARRLRATFRVAFGRNGKFSIRPELISPTRKPASDPPLNTFIVHAERALNMCNQIGWYIPEDYFRLPEPRTIDLEFLPKIGAEQ